MSGCEGGSVADDRGNSASSQTGHMRRPSRRSALFWPSTERVFPFVCPPPRRDAYPYLTQYPEEEEQVEPSVQLVEMTQHCNPTAPHCAQVPLG